MRRERDNYMQSIHHTAILKRRLHTIVPVLSFLVIIIVCWCLKLTGITMAGEAFCGIEEHVHNEQCTVRTLICSEDALADEPVLEQPPAEEPPAEETALEESEAAAEEPEAEEPPAEPVPEEPASQEEPAEEPPAEEPPAEEPVYEPPVTEEPPLSEEPVLPAPPEGHIHDDSCYEITHTCELEEHTHAASCYSDISADVETSADWEATLPELVPDAYADNIVAVATSQLGYTESELNFQVDAEDIRRGYTRYGEWFGNPYGDWSTMFTSFVLRYAGISDLPVSSGADALHIQWEEGQRYVPAADYTPIPGDVVFLDKNGNGAPEATAVITAVSDTEITVIEGDLDNQVAETVYLLTDSQITGYGLTTPDSLLALAAAQRSSTVLATLVNSGFSTSLPFSNSTFILYTEGDDLNYYAIDGNGNAVEIYIDNAGNVTSDTENPESLFWRFRRDTSSDSGNHQWEYFIQNVSTGSWLHPYEGPLSSGEWEAFLYQNGDGIQIQGARQSTYLSLQGTSNFAAAANTREANTMYLAQSVPEPAKVTVWLDGTCGGARSLRDSDNSSFEVKEGGPFILPTEWKSPGDYSYKVQGWYDVKNARYYLPGETVTVTEHMVFYPDWVAETYDIGHFNAQTADTVSTDGHITTHVFDYNFLFNVQSASANVTVDESSHSETWKLVTSGAVPFQNQETLDFVMTDNDTSRKLYKPDSLNSANTYTGGSKTFPGLYNETLADALFGTDNVYDPASGTGILGKTYLGTGDHLFQFASDPGSAYYGYYYFDSSLNGASYNQTDQRFYVYDYLHATSDSGKSDFLPLNGSDANTNGKNVETFTSNGTTNYEFDNFQSSTSADANLWFGLSMETRFYLPNDPGEKDASGEYGNKDVYGNDIHFSFSGDDDVWVLVDGQIVLDLGGIHQKVDGDINFSTGEVNTNGTISYLSDLKVPITAGEHTLTVLYLERGGGESNCQMRFNLAPRYSLTLQKEDVLTQEALNGAQFSVYEDLECTVPAQLWTSEASHNNGDSATNTFTVANGKTTMWGLGAGNTYYIRETRPPDNDEYNSSLVNGIICLTLDKSGNASYNVKISMGKDENGQEVVTSPGFTVHGFRIDEENQEAYIVATNAKKWVQEVTSIQAVKVWDDNEDHSGDSVTVYLTVKDLDGTVRRIREVELNQSNDWTWIWDNMPKYWNDSDKTKPVEYGVEEAYISGYTPTIEKTDKVQIVVSGWQPVNSIENGKTYLLKTASGYLSTTSATSTSSSIMKWETNEAAAKSSNLSLWTASVSGGKVKFTNGAGQKLSYNNGNNSNNRYFYATKNSSNYQSFTPVWPNNQDGVRFYITSGRSNYYMGSMSNSRLSATTTANSGLLFVPYTLVETISETPLEGLGFKVTNRPLENETSLTVTKDWDAGEATNVDYQQSQVPVKLLADGKDTGRTVTLTLRNSWTGTFAGLPYTNTDGSIIQYSVEETWASKEWSPVYGEIITVPPSGGKDANPTYETTITNVYQRGGIPALPSTGGLGSTPWILCGFSMMAGSLVYGYILRRKYERRCKKS